MSRTESRFDGTSSAGWGTRNHIISGDNGGGRQRNIYSIRGFMEVGWIFYYVLFGVNALDEYEAAAHKSFKETGACKNMEQ